MDSRRSERCEMCVNCPELQAAWRLGWLGKRHAFHQVVNRFSIGTAAVSLHISMTQGNHQRDKARYTVSSTYHHRSYRSAGRDRATPMRAAIAKLPKPTISPMEYAAAQRADQKAHQIRPNGSPQSVRPYTPFSSPFFAQADLKIQ